MNPSTRTFRLAATVSLLAAAVVIIGDALGAGWTQRVSFFYVTPLLVALVTGGGLRTVRGRWWAVGLVFSLLGDAFTGGVFVALLAAFLLAHVCFVAALWPFRSGSWLGRPRALGHLAVLAVALLVLVPRVDAGLVGPVIAYGLVLVLMAVLATAAGRAGTLGGALFMISDLTLGVTTFAWHVPTALQTLLVIGTYVPAQILLFAGLCRLDAVAARRR